jgi:hypothetical protein
MTRRPAGHAVVVEQGVGFGLVESSQATDRAGVMALGVLPMLWRGRVAVCGCSVGACGTARKPLAVLGLGPGGRPAGARRARWWRR